MVYANIRAALLLFTAWIHGPAAAITPEPRPGSDQVLLLPCCWLQVYDITMELVHMYDHYRKPISPDQCRSLLAVVRAPVPPPAAHDAAAAAALAAAAANAGAGQPPPSVAAPGGAFMPAAFK